jgi:hypothetical protein
MGFPTKHSCQTCGKDTRDAWSVYCEPCKAKYCTPLRYKDPAKIPLEPWTGGPHTAFDRRAEWAAAEDQRTMERGD